MILGIDAVLLAVVIVLAVKLELDRIHRQKLEKVIDTVILGGRK
jgi:hypothetical protein